MEVLRNIEEGIPEGGIVTIGFFDGVHLGHQYLLRKLKTMSSDRKSTAIVISMWPHPSEVINNQKIKLLTCLEEKIELIANLGIDYLIILDFTKQTSIIGKEEFINSSLINGIKASSLLQGYNNSFGNQDSSMLLSSSQNQNIEIIQANQFLINNNIPVNSTKIRDSILNGNIKNANDLLGYKFSIKGFVKEGFKIGRTLGFPTANLSNIAKEKIIPGSGVYAVKAKLNETYYPAMLNIGTRPTFGNYSQSIEFHLINQNFDMYEKEVELIFFEYLREEKKFDSIDYLKNQLELDKLKTIDYFNKFDA